LEFEAGGSLVVPDFDEHQVKVKLDALDGQFVSAVETLTVKSGAIPRLAGSLLSAVRLRKRGKLTNTLRAVSTALGGNTRGWVSPREEDRPANVEVSHGETTGLRTRTEREELRQTRTSARCATRQCVSRVYNPGFRQDAWRQSRTKTPDAGLSQGRAFTRTRAFSWQAPGNSCPFSRCSHRPEAWFRS
jgi:hypothetical protein